MEKKKLQNISIAALIISVLPFATLIPVFLQIVLPDGLRTVWGGVNIFIRPPIEEKIKTKPE